MIGGKLLAKKGESLFRGAPITWPEEMVHCLRIGSKAAPASFQIRCRSTIAKVRAMELAGQTITVEKILEVAAPRGVLEADPSRDLIKVAVFERHKPEGGVAHGFLKGFGARIGAVAVTTNLDENTLLVAGENDEDMALSAQVLLEAGGGIAVVDRGEVLENIEFPVGGIFSLAPWRETGKKLERVNRCLRERGAPFARPIYALSFLTFVTLPALRITARGLISAKDRKIVPLFADV
jgi:adenine deaminase